jgi:hypothetical protein
LDSATSAGRPSGGRRLLGNQQSRDWLAGDPRDEVEVLVDVQDVQDGQLAGRGEEQVGNGYVTTEWRKPPEGPRRRYHAITDDGRTALAEQQRQWVTVTRALGNAWHGAGGLPPALGEV